MTEILSMNFYFGRAAIEKASFKDILDFSTDFGCKIDYVDKGRKTVKYGCMAIDIHGQMEGPLEEAVATISKHKDGYLNLKYNGNLLTIGMLERKWEYDKDQGMLVKSTVPLYVCTVTAPKKWFRPLDRKLGEGENPKSRFFIDYGKAFFENFRPIYGQGGEGHPNAADRERLAPSNGRIMKGEITRLNWINFFGEDFVEKVGRDKLLSSPSWRTMEMEGGGIALAVSPDYQTVKSGKYERIERHIGLMS